MIEAYRDLEYHIPPERQGQTEENNRFCFQHTVPREAILAARKGGTMTESAIGTQIKEARQRVGLTQADVARSIGCESITVSRWERGVARPRPGLYRDRVDEWLGWVEDLAAK